MVHPAREGYGRGQIEVAYELAQAANVGRVRRAGPDDRQARRGQVGADARQRLHGQIESLAGLALTHGKDQTGLSLRRVAASREFARLYAERHHAGVGEARFLPQATLRERADGRQVPGAGEGAAEQPSLQAAAPRGSGVRAYQRHQVGAATGAQRDGRGVRLDQAVNRVDPSKGAVQWQQRAGQELGVVARLVLIGGDLEVVGIGAQVFHARPAPGAHEANVEAGGYQTARQLARA